MAAIRRAVLVVVGVAIVAACSGTAATPRFSLSLRNAGDQAVRLRVIANPAAPPSTALLVPAHSAVLRTPEADMTRTPSGEVQPVSIEVYTETCALIASASVGEGASRVVIGPEFALTVESTSASSDDAVEPESVPAC